jgi:hypothetical protein
MPPNPALGAMSFSIPADLMAYLQDIDNFISTKIAPLQASSDNQRFFDHRREHARVCTNPVFSQTRSDIFNRPIGIIMAFHVTNGKSF